MNPQHNSNQNPASTSAVQQVNPVINPQMINGNAGGLFPNNMPVAAPLYFMNIPAPPFQLQNNIGGFNPQHPFPVNQFNPSQQQQGQFFAQNPMNPTAYHQNVGLQGQQVLLQNTIQNICQLLQLQNPNYTQCPPGNFLMFPNQIVNPQNPGFPVNQQFGMPSSNGPVQHGPQNMGQQLQGNLFLPGASGSVQTQQPQNHHPTSTNFQNQIAQGVGPQIHNVSTNQMFGMANMNETVQNVNQGHLRFEGHHKNAPANVNGGGIESQHKNFTGHKTYDASHKGSKSHKHVKEKLGIYKGNMSKEVGNNSSADSVSRNFTKKVPSLSYTAQEINEWREARKKNYPTNGTILKKRKKEHALSVVTNQEAMLRCQQLKEILAKQAELGCEVADIPASYLSGLDKQNPRENKHERHHYKKGKFRNKRGKPSYQDRMAKKKGRRDQKPDHQRKREPSLLQKLLTQDIKRDKNRLLQVFRFITTNSFLTGESMRFPVVKVRETNVDEVATCSPYKAEEEEEGEIID